MNQRNVFIVIFIIFYFSLFLTLFRNMQKSKNDWIIVIKDFKDTIKINGKILKNKNKYLYLDNTEIRMNKNSYMVIETKDKKEFFIESLEGEKTLYPKMFKK